MATGKFRIRRTDPDEEPEFLEVEGVYVDGTHGLFAVRKSDDPREFMDGLDWVLTHTPTGYAVFRTDNLDTAMRVGRQLYEAGGAAWTLKSAAAVREALPLAVSAWCRRLSPSNDEWIPFKRLKSLATFVRDYDAGGGRCSEGEAFRSPPAPATC